MVLPPPNGMPGMDPMGGGAPEPDPTGGMAEEIMLMAEDVRRAIEEQVNLLTNPVYPPWYDEKDYPKPEPGRMLTIARRLESEYAPLRSRIADDLKAARMDVSGTFRDFNPDEDDAWKDSGIAGEIELIASQLADATLSYDAPARKVSEEDEAAKKIDFAIFCNDEAERQHSMAGNGPMRMDIARTLLLTGRIAWHVMINPDADEDESPFIESLVDPATCMPVFESNRGLRTMVRVYTTTVGEAIGAFSTSEHDLSHLLDSRGPDGKFKKKREEHEICEIVEYWDRKWRAVFLDGDLVLGPVAHDYGFVPFVYKLGGLGMPAYLKDPSHATARDVNGIEFTTQWRARDASLPNKGISLVGLLRVPHFLREAVMTKLLTAFDTSIKPPLIAAMDDITYPEGVPEISREKNAVSPVKMNRQEIQPLPTDPSPTLMGPILQGVADNGSRLMLPATAHGQNDKSNVAGYATNLLNEAGLTKTVWAKQTIEDFERERAEMRLRLFRDWGHLIKQGRNGTQGALIVPRSDPMPDEDRTFELTPGDLRRTGIKMKVSLSTMPIQMLGPVGNAISILKNLGLIDDVRALKLLQDPNPHKTLKRVQLEKALKDPVIEEIRVIEGLVSEGLEGYAQFFLARKMGQKMQDQMAATAGGAQPGIPEAGSPVQTTVGDSNAQYGYGPGPGSGPQGSEGGGAPLPPPVMTGTEP